MHNDKRPLVSVIIPCHNVAGFLNTCHTAVMAQTYPALEIIYIDNNSSDSTWETLTNLQQKFPAIIIDQETTPGAPAARNKGFSRSRGEWIQFLDADDVLLPEKIENQVLHLLNADNNAAVAFIAGAFKLQEEGRTSIIAPETKNIWSALAQVRLGITSANLFSRKFLELVKGWSTTLKSSQEYDLMFRLLKAGGLPLANQHPETIIVRRHGSISTASENRAPNLLRRIEHLEEIKQHVGAIHDGSLHDIKQAQFDVIRELYLYDSKQSIELFGKLLGKNYPVKTSTAVSLKYILLHKLFGFSTANFLLRLLRR